VTAALLLTIAEAYLGIGLVLALVLVVLVGKVDHAARGAYLFRPLLVPGATLLWPLVLLKLLARRGEVARAHRGEKGGGS